MNRPALPDEARSEEADVCVVGGGPAGAAAAACLASRGRRVTLFERTRFPRWHVGESLTPKVRSLFEFLGVAETIDAAGFVRMAGNTHRWASAELETTPFLFDGTAAEGYQVDRQRFDGILLDAARERGVRALEGVSVRRLLHASDEVVCGVEWSRAEVRGTVRSRVVIDASGQPGIVPRLLGLRRREPLWPETMAVVSYWRGPLDLGPETLVEAFAEGWFWSLPLATGVRNVTLFADLDTVRRWRPRPLLDLLRRSARDAPRLRDYLDGARPVFGPRATDVTWYDSRSYAGAGYMVAGDAASFVDPLSSQGVFKALESAVAAALAVDYILENPEDAERAIRWYQREQTRVYRTYRRLMAQHYALVTNWLDTPFWRRRRIEPPDEPTAPDAETRRRRRELLRAYGRDGKVPGLRFVWTAPSTRVESDLVAEEGRLRPRMLIRSDDAPWGTTIPDDLDAERFFGLVDGRPVRDLISGWNPDGSVPPRSVRERLMETLTRLHEDGMTRVSE